ncbi:MAG: hypothetical protein WB609_01970 [Candidatus Cybelea sp.]
MSGQPGAQGEATIAASPVTLGSRVAGALTPVGSNSKYPIYVFAYDSSDGGKTWQGHQLPPSPAAIQCARRHHVATHSWMPSVRARYDGVYFFLYTDTCWGNGGAEAVLRSSSDGGHTWSPISTAFAGIAHRPAVSIDVARLAIDNGASSPTKGRIYVAFSEQVPSGNHIELVWSDDSAITWHSPVEVDGTA